MKKLRTFNAQLFDGGLLVARRLAIVKMTFCFTFHHGRISYSKCGVVMKYCKTAIDNFFWTLFKNVLKVTLNNDIYCHRQPINVTHIVAKHIGAETKWSPFLRRRFQVLFVEWKLLNFKQNFTEMCSLGSYWQYGSIGSDNGWMIVCLCVTRYQWLLTFCG